MAIKRFILLFAIVLPSFARANGRVTLKEYLALVAEQSPDLSVERAKVEAAKQRASGVRIEPPMIGYMQMKDADGTNNGIEISQAIPFPTKINGDKRTRELELDAQKGNTQLQEASIHADARRSYIAFWAAFSRLGIQREKLSFLRTHLKIARTTSWSDTEARLHLLQIESEADLLENEVLGLEADLLETRAALRVFAPGFDSERAVPVEPATVEIRLEKSKIGNSVAWLKQELAAREAALRSKNQSYLPDFYLRLRAFDGNANTPRSQELMVGVSLPFAFFWQPRAEVAEAYAQKKKAEAELQKALVELETKLVSLVKRSEATQAQLKNLKEKLIPRAERRMKLVGNVSRRTMEGLDQHRAIMLGLLDLKLQEIDLRLDGERVATEAIKLTGASPEIGVGQ